MSGTTDGADVLDRGIRAAAEHLARASRIVVLTGAGVSAASGVPTFRGAGGLWQRHRAEDLATPEAFARDPGLVWAWYEWRRQRIAACAPNAAHDVLASWGRRWPHLTLVTQNVDGLHERAGSQGVLRLHGSIWHVHCSRPCPRGRAARPFPLRPDLGGRVDRDVRVSPAEDGEPRRAPALPLCESCGALERPSVVWFGERLDAAIFDRAAAAVAAADVCVVAGTSAVVFPAAGLIGHAARHGAAVVEINPDASALADHAAIVLRAPAELALPRIDAAFAAAVAHR